MTREVGGGVRVRKKEATGKGPSLFKTPLLRNKAQAIAERVCDGESTP